jgi:dipeptidyl aminopeptidase/acylaminoacyl peptidase
MKKQPFAFGHWPSPLTAASVAEGALRFGRVQVFDNAVYWSEGRPAEKGRAPVMRWSEKEGVLELLPAPYSARSRVHEYGGGEFTIAGGRLYFVNDADQDIYEAGLTPGSSIARLTDLPDTRFADMTWDGRRKRLIAAGESHDPAHRSVPQNALWTITAGAGRLREGAAILLGRHDFYASPRLSPDGNRLAFLAWDLPSMPWDAAKLFVADIAGDGSPGDPISIAGGDGSACFEPQWGEDGALYFVWDPDGLGNLFRWRASEQPWQITHLDAELSMPLWSFNAASYALLAGGKAYLTFVTEGELQSAIVDLRSLELKPHENGLTTALTLSAGEDNVALAGMTDHEALCIILDKAPLRREGPPAILRRSSSFALDGAYVSRPRRIAIAGTRGPVHGLLYPPGNAGANGPAGDLPPLIISLHGGPTSSATRGLKFRTLFFTTRGFSLLDLDYSGSTGYGRAYRDRLNGNWGVADVDDTIAAARFAASAGLADPEAIFVTGGSAGGYTVLAAIAAASLFRGAASYYGICDLVGLQKSTHKFEQGYQSTLLGAAMEEDEALYRERSPINRAERINTPLILFQGAEDYVVPKEQSIAIAQALRAKQVQVEYHEFAGEGHGFRKSETIGTCLERELAFYRMLMGG